MILRFMGDLRDPVPQEEPKEATSTGLRKKLSGTFGRKSKHALNKLEKEFQETVDGEEDDDEHGQVNIYIFNWLHSCSNY